MLRWLVSFVAWYGGVPWRRGAGGIGLPTSYAGLHGE